MVKKILMCLFFCVPATVSYAKSVEVQKTIQFENPKKQSQLFVIQNKSQHSFWLIYVKQKNPGASAGWYTKITPDRSTVLLLSKPRFNLMCNMIKKGGGASAVSCEKYFSVKKMKKYEVPKKALGQSYWVVENVKKTDLQHHLNERGFRLRIK